MFVYHRKHDNMVGTVLYPLNTLQYLMPDVYEMQKLKYAGREAVMDCVVPLLDCKWNDVIHLSPMHPSLAYRELVAAGLDPDPDRLFFKIPVQQLCAEKTVFYKYERDKISVNDNQFFPFLAEKFENLTALPQKTKDYYHDRAAQGERPLVFRYVPHVLTLDVIETKNVDVVSWSSL